MKLHSQKKQAGMSLMEVLIAMSIGLVVTASMIALMANSLRSTARIINMTKLSDDMRTTMQMMTRDVRRSSYKANSMFCYANTNCRSAVDATVAGDITINGGNDCFTFLLDREWDSDGIVTNNDAGGFRRKTSGGVGVIEMWTGNAAPDCSVVAGTAGWVQITNPENMDIFVFSVDDDLSYNQVVLDDGLGNILTEKVRKIRMNMRGRLVVDNSIIRRIEDVISVRNDLLF